MAAWIELHTNVGDHSKTRKLMRRLQWSKGQAVGGLVLLWQHMFATQIDGDLRDHDPEDIADIMCWAGDPADLMRALEESGFIRDGFIVNADKYWGRYDHQRKMNAERQARRRAKLAGESTGDTVLESSAEYDPAPRNADTTPCHAHTEPNHADVTRDKRKVTRDRALRNASQYSTVQDITEHDTTGERSDADASGAIAAVDPVDGQPSPQEPIPAEPQDASAGIVTAERPANPIWQLIEAVCAITGAVPSDWPAAHRSKMSGAAKALLKDYSAPDVIGCARWLWSDDWRRGNGVDLLTIRTNIQRWIDIDRPAERTHTKPAYVTEAPTPSYYRMLDGGK